MSRRRFQSAKLQFCYQESIYLRYLKTGFAEWMRKIDEILRTDDGTNILWALGTGSSAEPFQGKSKMGDLSMRISGTFFKARGSFRDGTDFPRRNSWRRAKDSGTLILPWTGIYSLHWFRFPKYAFLDNSCYTSKSDESIYNTLDYVNNFIDGEVGFFGSKCCQIVRQGVIIVLSVDLDGSTLTFNFIFWIFAFDYI